MRRLIIAAAALAVIVGFGGAGAADAPLKRSRAEGLLNKLLAPGPLIEGHANLEQLSCLKCHETGKGVPDSKCLECHKEQAAQVAQKHGFHGHQKKACVKCHSDHKGRANDTTIVNEKTFDHKQTDFTLDGKHAKIKCAQCHIEKRTKKPIRPEGIRYFGRTTTCVSCHKKDDIHKFPPENAWAQKDCSACHGTAKWKTDIRFSHERDGHFKLVGKHAKLKCAECHIPKNRPANVISIYKWPEIKQQHCLSCHQDVHKANLSARFRTGKCDTCHNHETWKLKFNHQATGYILHGAHAPPLDCFKCHKQPEENVRAAVTQGRKAYKWAGLKQDCLTCHKDYHLFGDHKARHFEKLSACQTCHNDVKWKDIHSFNHNTQTRYPIDGKHVGLKCAKCHIKFDERKQPTAATYAWKDFERKTCETCHTNPHQKTFSEHMLKRQCTDCHLSGGWAQHAQGRFNHDTATRFKLLGKHRPLTCDKCHVIKPADVAQSKVSVTPSTNMDAGAAIDTATATATINSIVQEPVVPGHPASPPATIKKIHTFRWNSTASKDFCTSCHLNLHREQFTERTRAQACSKCHTAENFTQRLQYNHEQTGFKLRNKHAEAKCDKCHYPMPNIWLNTVPRKVASKYRFPEVSAGGCASCHRDPHKGSFELSCTECHSDQTWKTTPDFHKNFTLSGVHFSLACSECHKNGRRLMGLSEKCVLCHQKDDVHHGTQPQCGDCHRQQFWENPEFRHSLTRFPLRGIHRTLDCTLCHPGTIYRGTPYRCISCHQKDAQSVVFPPHFMPQFIDCERCHNQFGF